MAKVKDSVSLKKNVIYNILLTVSTYFISFIIYPYITRTLGVSNIGLVNFVNKTIDIFIMISMLGIPIVGIREISSNVNDKNKLSSLFSSIVNLNIVITAITILLYILCIIFIPVFKDNINYFLIGILKLVSSTFLIEWFFQGIEKFKFITLRNILIKILYIICVFIFVKDSSDVNIYYCLTIGLISVNGIVNWIASRKYVKFVFTFKYAGILIKSIIFYGLYNLFNSSFSTLNYTILGVVKNNTEVGYYNTAEQFYLLFLSVITAATKAMLPRMSNLLSLNNREQFNNYINISLQLVLKICLPLTIVGVCMSEELVLIIAGEGYEGAIIPLKIMMILVLVNGINQVLITQAAIPLKYDNAILKGVIMSSLIAIVLDFFWVNRFGAVGSALILVICVIIGSIYPNYKLLSNKEICISIQPIIKETVKAVPYIIISIGLKALVALPPYLELVLVCFISLLYFICVNKTIVKQVMSPNINNNN